MNMARTRAIDLLRRRRVRPQPAGDDAAIDTTDLTPAQDLYRSTGPGGPRRSSKDVVAADAAAHGGGAGVLRGAVAHRDCRAARGAARHHQDPRASGSAEAARPTCGRRVIHRRPRLFPRGHRTLLGALSPDDQRAFEVHLATCAECQAEVRSLGAVVAALPYAAGDAEPPRTCATACCARRPPRVNRRMSCRSTRARETRPRPDRGPRNWPAGSSPPQTCWSLPGMYAMTLQGRIDRVQGSRSRWWPACRRRSSNCRPPTRPHQPRAPAWRCSRPLTCSTCA